MRMFFLIATLVVPSLITRALSRIMNSISWLSQQNTTVIVESRLYELRLITATLIWIATIERDLCRINNFAVLMKLFKITTLRPLEDTNVDCPRCSSRIRKPPNFLNDYHHNINNSTQINLKGKTKYPISSVLSYKSLSDTHLCFTMAISSHIKPRNFKEACKYPEWIAAMKT